MTDSATWQEGNSRYLSAALIWLRACMESFIAGQREKSPPVRPAREQVTGGGSIWKQLMSRPAALNAPPSTLLLTDRGASPDERVTQAAHALQSAATGMQPPPALAILAQQFGLSTFEQQIMILCIGMELDTGIAGLCARCQNDPSRAYPTFALGLSLFTEPAWDALSPDHPLRYWRLIEISQAPGQPLTASPLRTDERIVNYVKGLNHLDDRLSDLVSPMVEPEPPGDLPPSLRSIVEALTRRLGTSEADERWPLIQLLGVDSATKQAVAREAARGTHLQLYTIPSGSIPPAPADAETFVRLWQRENLLLPLALYVDASDAPTDPGGHRSPVSRFLGKVRGTLFLDTREPWPGLDQPTVTYEIAKLPFAEQSAAWEAALGSAAGKNPAILAGQFNLSFPAIRRIAREAMAETGGPRPLEERLWAGCLEATRPQLDILARRIDPKATWDDIVLPVAETSLLHRIADQVRQRATVYETWGFSRKLNRGLGISALFAGDSGTGKTMAAEVIANDLRLNLYRIDLSAVVSKYIGETEKNLSRLFDAAEDGGSILFFDEADALFGKRSEVKDSHDRYANIEINYLLQRMEAYSGLAILATNMKGALDPAFLRRLRFVVNFPFPAPAERKGIWEKAFPPDVPRENIDAEHLSTLNLTGGQIHNIALQASFLAAQEGSLVTMALILQAARTEFRKNERPINELDFHWQLKARASR